MTIEEAKLLKPGDIITSAGWTGKKHRTITQCEIRDYNLYWAESPYPFKLNHSWPIIEIELVSTSVSKDQIVINNYEVF